MGESAKNTHVQGLYTVIVAVIALVGGILLRDPIQKAISPKYANIGGVWKAHGDLVTYCEVSTVRDTFYISLTGQYVSGDHWNINGHGKLGKNSGEFTGKMKIGSNSDFEIWGNAETAGSDQLGITVFFDKEHKQSPKTYAFIREVSSSVDNPQDEKIK